MSYNTQIILHMVLMIGFLFFAAAGIITARYFKKRNPKWLRIHKILMSIGLGLAVMGISWIVYVIQINFGVHLALPHHFLGILTLIIAASAPVLGFRLMSPNTDNSVKPILRKLHKFAGRLSLGLIALSAFTGLVLFGIISVPFLYH